ncbi:phosphate:Na+ symporter [Cocleimonas flava]|uniref:Phosphate:Na+ symporter n=1 Tax=Cocleimonas flava TaxID=634765 RepID=A0A4R1F1N2_9GAMM|nr:phosphate:Na+ symporter [Cocleimonas flava]
MFRNILLLSIFAILSYGFWVSPNLKEITAGVAIFLFGMLSLEEGFKAFTGGLLEKILNKTTNGLWKSMSFGVVTTTLMQSSSLVSVITISFLSAGLITLASGIGIIFGANLGTTTGAWLVAGLGLKVNISAYAMPMLVFGIILVLQKPKELKGIGYILAGLGFLFLGIHYMKEGFETFREHIDLTAYALSGLKGLLIYTLIGIIATVIMQSSHATLVLIITALASQQITYENALALAIGSNVGTTVTAIIGSISANINGKRLAIAHLVFNVVTGLVAITLIAQLITAVDWLSIKLGIASDNYTLKLAVFHTLFNLLGIALMLPFINKLGLFITKLLPEKEHEIAEPLYLNDAALELPEMALEAVRKETFNLYKYYFGIVCHGLSFRERDIKSYIPVEEIIQSHRKPIPVNIKEEYTNKIKGLYAEIVNFIGKANENMTQEQSNEVFELRSAGRAMLESIKSIQHLHKNLSHYINNPNPYIRAEYNQIRFRLGSILRGLSDLQNDPDEHRTALATLEAMKVGVLEADKQFFTDMNQLIREKHITGVMATSLMNDHSYTNNIANKLIEIGTILFKSQNTTLHEIEKSLMLDEKETAEAIAARKTTEQGAKEGKHED